MNYIWIELKLKDKDKVLLKCYKYNIIVYETKNQNDLFLLKIASQDYKKFKKVIYVKWRIQNKSGLWHLTDILKKYYIFLISLILGFILFFILNHVIVNVKIIHSKEEIRDLLQNALSKYGIKKNTWKKEYHELEQIKQNILDEYPEKLEWLEIETKGMNYIVRVLERKMAPITTEKTKCNIVANKSGLIKKLIYSKGEALVKTNDLVNKGDILISGTVKKDEEIKKEVCATGQVYAEVWYKATIKVPLHREELIDTGKVRWNIKIKNNRYNDFLFKSRITNYTTENHFLFSLFSNAFYFVKQHEVTKKIINYSDEELLTNADKLITEKINKRLEPKEEIITKKILTKEKDDNYFIVQYFLAILEQIGTEQPF